MTDTFGIKYSRAIADCRQFIEPTSAQFYRRHDTHMAGTKFDQVIDCQSYHQVGDPDPELKYQIEARVSMNPRWVTPELKAEVDNEAYYEDGPGAIYASIDVVSEHVRIVAIAFGDDIEATKLWIHTKQVELDVRFKHKAW